MTLRLLLLLLVPLIGLLACGRDEEAASRTLLVTAFGPFGSYEANPSWEATRGLEGERIGPVVVRTARLDVAYERAGAQLAQAIEATDPDTVLCLGVAPGAEVRIEVVARNLDDCPHPDVEGVVRAGRPIRPGGPALLPTRLPVKALRTALAEAGYPVLTSEDAGGYLCNHVFYRLIDRLADGRAAGFVHVPELSEAWDLPRLRRAVRLMAETLVRGR